jgi:DNA-binding MarR family transcriptional regulator
MTEPSSKDSEKAPARGVPFLLSQVGAHVAARFAERIAPLGLKPFHAGILSVLEKHPGMPQQALSELLGMFPSRLVGLLDDLEQLKLIERRESPSDRRIYAVHLTQAGRKASSKISKMAGQLEDDLCAALNDKERKGLADLLGRIVSQQQITPGVHPGYRKMGGACGSGEADVSERG